MDQEELKKAMQQAQEMQEGLLRVQEELSNELVDAVSPDKFVRVIMSAQGDFRAIELNTNLLSLKYSDIKTAGPVIEKSVLAAIRKATEKATDLTKDKLQVISNTMGLES